MVEACRQAGVRAIEITNRESGTYELFRELTPLVSGEQPEMILGVGTIHDAPTAALFIAAGAGFVVSPVLNADVARLCNRRRVAYLPGCGTASEISEAEELGVEIVKLFPAAAFNGPAFVRGILGPSPRSRIMPTNVEATKEATEAWFYAGVACVGVGPALISDALQEEGDPTLLTSRVAEYIGWIRAARTGS